MSRLQEEYKKNISSQMMSKFNYKNFYQIPKLQKIVLNMGVGEASQDRKKIEAAVEEMALIAGQKPIITVARKSIATFKIRTGMPLGVKVTLRGNRMYEFVDRLVTIALPRIRDFRGLKKNCFDGRGNYSFGIKECTVFPEINVDKLDKVRGLDITINTTATHDEQALLLLKSLNFPIND